MLESLDSKTLAYHSCTLRGHSQKATVRESRFAKLLLESLDDDTSGTSGGLLDKGSKDNLYTVNVLSVDFYLHKLKVQTSLEAPSI